MKTLLLAGLFFFCSLISLGQENIFDNKDEITQIRVRKHFVVNDLETQIKEIPFAAVRVYARYRLASWLWKDGKDDTGRAEEIAIAAIDDHYKNKDEIPPQYFCDSQLFLLLDTHSKDLAKQQREKYKRSSEDESRQIPALLGQTNGDKLAVDTALRLLSAQSDKSPDLVYLLMRLEQQGSTELNRLLTAILVAEEAGRTRFLANMIEIFAPYFMKSDVPLEIQRRFLGLIVGRSRNVAAMPVPEQWAYYRLLQRFLPEISAKYPEMLGEASTAHALLSARVSRSTRDANERYERISNSPDKLSATVDEAERAEDKTIKYGLFRNAARLALEKDRFVYAVDLMKKASEIDITASGTSAEFSKMVHDQFYRDVVRRSLGANEADAGNYAIKAMDGSLSKAEGLSQISNYYLDNSNLDAGRYAYDEAIRLISRAKITPEGIGVLIRMLPTAVRMDSSRLSELSQMIAKKINTIPSLNPEDKPDTPNYSDYVTKVMLINSNLVPALTSLAKENRNAATDLADRIERKEVRVIANYILLADSINISKETKKGKESARLHQ